VGNLAEDQVLAPRTLGLVKVERKKRRPPSALLAGARRTTQRSMKFIRWFRDALRKNLMESDVVPRLTTIYAIF
jgi:hypothetical protein